jgi:hypothetical protein
MGLKNIEFIIIKSRVVSETELKNSTSPFLPWVSEMATKGLIALPPEIDCNQPAKDLPLLKSSVFHITMSIW